MSELLALALHGGASENVTIAGIGGELQQPSADESPEDAVEVIEAFEPKPPSNSFG